MVTLALYTHLILWRVRQERSPCFALTQTPLARFKNEAKV